MIGCSAHHPWLPGITSGLLVFSDAARHTLGCLRFRHISRLGGWDGYTTLLLNFYTTIFDPICHRDIRPLELNAVLVSKNRSSLVVHLEVEKYIELYEFIKFYRIDAVLKIESKVRF